MKITFNNTNTSNRNKCLICNSNKNILLSINYLNKYKIICHEKCKNKFIFYLEILLKEQELLLDYSNLNYIDIDLYKDINNNINENEQIIKYNNFLKKYNIHKFSNILKKINLTNEDNKNLGKIFFVISQWI